MNVMTPELNWTFAIAVLSGAGTLFGVAVLLSMAGGRLLIPWLVRKKLNDGEQRKASDYLNMLHADKKNTPTMGGAFLVPAAMIAAAMGGAVLTYLGADPWRVWPALGLAGFAVMAHAGLGLWDDYCKLTKRGKDGISGKKKLVAQTFIATLACTGAYLLVGDANAHLVLPFTELHLGVLMIPVGVFIMVGASNAYNLTDGLDGLATGLSIIAFGAFLTIASMYNEYEIATFLSIIIGALIGFLIYNKYPAKLFMGDTGSLALGGLIGIVSIMINNSLLLLIIGVVFVIETASVILQVASFKLTGKRIFKMTPIHHHFELLGWSEWKIVGVFWTTGAVGGIIGILLGGM